MKPTVFEDIQHLKKFKRPYIWKCTKYNFVFSYIGKQVIYKILAQYYIVFQHYKLFIKTQTTMNKKNEDCPYICL